MCCCQDTMEETGRIKTVESITTIGSKGGFTRARVACIHGDSWEALLIPGDPLYRYLAHVRLKMYSAA